MRRRRSFAALNNARGKSLGTYRGHESVPQLYCEVHNHYYPARLASRHGEDAEPGYCPRCRYERMCVDAARRQLGPDASRDEVLAKAAILAGHPLLTVRK